MSDITVQNGQLDTQPKAEILASSANLHGLTETFEKNGVEALRYKVAAGNMIVFTWAHDDVMNRIYAGSLPIARLVEASPVQANPLSSLPSIANQYTRTLAG